MANKKRNKYPAQSKITPDARRYNVKAGEYNGGSSSQDFMVSGHSTGSPYSEMEELSEQLTRDVGGLPYKHFEFGSDQGETGYDEYQGEGLGDLGGPEFYGDKPSLLKKSPIHHAGTSRGLAIGAAVGLAATTLLGGLAYFFYQNAQTETPVRKARKTTTRTTTRVASRAAAAAVAAPKIKARKATKSSRARKSARASH